MKIFIIMGHDYNGWRFISQLDANTYKEAYNYFLTEILPWLDSGSEYYFLEDQHGPFEAKGDY